MIAAVAAGVSTSGIGVPGQRRSGDEPDHQQGCRDGGQRWRQRGGGSHAVVSFAPPNASTQQPPPALSCRTDCTCADLRWVHWVNQRRSSTFAAFWQAWLNHPIGTGRSGGREDSGPTDGVRRDRGVPTGQLPLTASAIELDPSPGPSLVRGTRRTNGQPGIITDTGRAAHALYCQLDRPPSCPLQRRGHRFEPCHAHQTNQQVSRSRGETVAASDGGEAQLGRTGAAAHHESRTWLASNIASRRSRRVKSASGYRWP